MLKLIALACVAALATVGVAHAQDMRRLVRPGQIADDGSIVVQSSRSFTLPLKGDDASVAQQDEAVRLIYRMAQHECAALLETIAASCQLTGVSTNVNVNEEPMQRLRANGTITMSVKLK